MILGNEAEAHIWRSQMLRILTQPPIDSATDAALTPRVKEVASRLAAEFLKGPARLLFRPALNDAEQIKRDLELQKLCHGAGVLSLSLWSHRAVMICHCLDQLPVFSLGRFPMTAHRLHRLDEEDNRLSAKKVIAVIQPAIIAYGNEDAENYDKGKLWASAVVLVDETA
jgi:hypothetical protein